MWKRERVIPFLDGLNTAGSGGREGKEASERFRWCWLCLLQAKKFYSGGVQTHITHDTSAPGKNEEVLSTWCTTPISQFHYHMLESTYTSSYNGTKL